MNADFIAGFEACLVAIRGPRVARPDGITDAHWVNWWGAKRNDDGSISPPMSVAHLFPDPKNSKAHHMGHARALASQRPAASGNAA